MYQHPLANDMEEVWDEFADQEEHFEDNHSLDEC